MEYIFLFLIKFIDNIITTAKNISLYKNKVKLSAFFTIISQFLFFFIISKIVTDGSLVSIFVVSIAAGLGSYFASFINNKITKDKTWINVITCSDLNKIESLSKYLYNKKIKCVMYDAYNRHMEKTYAIQAFAKTKEESLIIDNFIKENKLKCLREIVN